MYVGDRDTYNDFFCGICGEMADHHADGLCEECHREQNARIPETEITITFFHHKRLPRTYQRETVFRSTAKKTAETMLRAAVSFNGKRQGSEVSKWQTDRYGNEIATITGVTGYFQARLKELD